jgi:NADPH-dependent ferric siderophore reductase
MSAERPFALHTGVATATSTGATTPCGRSTRRAPRSPFDFVLHADPGRPACNAVVEVAGPEEHQPADCAAELELRWVPRGGLRRAVRDLELPGEPGQAWGGGEARTMRDVRRHLQAHRPDLAMRLLGYWKR